MHHSSRHDPLDSQSSLEFEMGSVSARVDLRLGARLTRFRLGDKDALLDASIVAGTDNANNFGATFWPSPQSAWGWPPPPALDLLPYRAEAEGSESGWASGTVTLLDGSRLSVRKVFRALEAQGAFEISYTIRNEGDRLVEVAPWQITRVRAGGTTFFRLGPGGIDRDDLATEQRGDFIWYQYNPDVVTREGQKTLADATGWVAHLSGDLLLVQKYPDVAPGAAAPGEAEMELYANPGRTYVEIEPQGRLCSLPPGARSEPWTVRWFLRCIPGGIDRSSGSDALVELVQSIVGT